MPRPRLHKSSVVVGAIVAILLVLIEIPGRVIDGAHGPNASLVFEHGWPWIYLRRETVEPPLTYTTPEGLTLFPAINWIAFEIPWSLPNWGIPWLSSANWRFWQASKESGTLHWGFNGVVMFSDIAVALFVVAAIIAAWEFRRRRRPSLLSFGLADMFLVVASVSAVLGWFAYHEREYLRERQLLAQADRIYDVWYAGDYVCIAPIWISSLTGEQWLPKFAWRTSSVNIQRTHQEHVATTCEQIAKLKCVTKVTLHNSGARFRFSALRNLEQLETLELCGFGGLDGNELDELARLAQLRKIIIDDIDELEVDRLSQLQAKLPRCEIVGFSDDW